MDWVYAPVADLGNEPRNPIVATRALGADPDAVARGVSAWTLGCTAGGGLACAKHFPGHGRTLTDSHLELPVVDAGLRELARDLVPFAAAVAAGVPSIMSAHVAYPALDRQGLPATRSVRILDELLRARLDFHGVVVSDAMIMEGIAGGESEADAAVQALHAGVDALLYPKDTVALAKDLERALGNQLSRERAQEAAGRLDHMKSLVPPAPSRAWGQLEDRAWARETALRTVRLLGEGEGYVPPPLSLITVDDDVGGPYAAPDRSTFHTTLARLGVPLVPVADPPPGEGSRLLVVYADVRGWKGRVDLSEQARETTRNVLSAPGPVLVVLFSHPWNAVEIPPPVPVLCAWGGEPLMQEAAAHAVARLVSGQRPGLRPTPPGSLSQAHS